MSSFTTIRVILQTLEDKQLMMMVESKENDKRDALIE
jgi:hypothetical protein